MENVMSSGEYEELYLASVRVPLVLAVFLGLWGLVILVLQMLQIDFSSVLRKASGELRICISPGTDRSSVVTRNCRLPVFAP